ACGPPDPPPCCPLGPTSGRPSRPSSAVAAGTASLAGEVVPAEPEPAQQDEKTAGPGAHDKAQPLAQGGDAIVLPAAQVLQHEQGQDHDDETDDCDNPGHHSAVTSAPGPTRRAARSGSRGP